MILMSDSLIFQMKIPFMFILLLISLFLFGCSAHQSAHLSLMQNAVILDDIGKAKELLNSGHKPNFDDLIIAIRGNSLPMVQLLIKNGVDVNENKDGVFPLLAVAHLGYTGIARSLLAAGASINSKNESGITPLMRASERGHIELVRILLENGADVNPTGPNGHIPIQSTALCSAAGRGHLEIVKNLIDHDADINQSCIIFGQIGQRELSIEGNALMVASLNGYPEIVEVLLTLGADIDKCATENDIKGYDALLLSALNGHTDVARILLNHGANPNRRSNNDGKGIKAAHEAIAKDHLDFVILLFENGLKIESSRGNDRWDGYEQWDAQLAHVAGDYYALFDEAKAVQYYQQAVEFYPQAVKNYKGSEARYRLKEFGKVLFTVAAGVLGAYGAQTQANIMANANGVGVSTYHSSIYKPNMSPAEFYRLNAEITEENYNICKAILNCYGKNEPDIKLVDCIEKSGGALKLGQK